MSQSRLILLLSSVLALGGILSLTAARTCSPAETANECVVEDAFKTLWTEGGAGSLDSFRTALRNDPASPHRWFDLADATLLAGNSAEAASYAHRALALGPRMPSILLRTLNFAVLTGSCSEEALRSGQLLLEITPGRFDDIITGQLTRAGCDAAQIKRFTAGGARRP